MKLKDRILITLLLTIGLLLHYLSPGIFFGMKMDFLLISIVVSIILIPTFENYLMVAFLGGMFSALTTSFPGGQLPNIIDKIISTYIIYRMVLLFYKNIDKKAILGLIGFIGTFVSGSIFLLSARLILGLTDIGLNLIFAVVIPTAIINSIGTIFIYSIVKRSLKVYAR